MSKHAMEARRLLSPGGIARRERPILLLGGWQSASTHDGGALATAVGILRCGRLDELSTMVQSCQPEWLLIGLEIDDYDVQRAVHVARAERPAIRLALLGRTNDWHRCESWLRRGCDAYLDSSASVTQVLSALEVDSDLEVSVVHRSFHRVRHIRAQRPRPKLTRRETEVLNHLFRGMSNREIAEVLHVSENTIEYHMRHLLSKLEARNRLKAVEQATALGLV